MDEIVGSFFIEFIGQVLIALWESCSWGSRSSVAEQQKLRDKYQRPIKPKVAPRHLRLGPETPAVQIRSEKMGAEGKQKLKNAAND